MLPLWNWINVGANCLGLTEFTSIYMSLTNGFEVVYVDGLFHHGIMYVTKLPAIYMTLPMVNVLSPWSPDERKSH